MTLEELQREIKNRPYHLCEDIKYCVIALNGEAGEVAELVKKQMRSNPLSYAAFKEKMALELGDVLLYLVKTATTLGIPLQELVDKNFEKYAERKKKHGWK